MKTFFIMAVLVYVLEFMTELSEIMRNNVNIDEMSSKCNLATNIIQPHGQCYIWLNHRFWLMLKWVRVDDDVTSDHLVLN